MKKLLALSIALACVLLTQVPSADDGMWTFDNPPLKLWKDKYNFEPTPQWLEHVRLASPRVEGASGAFVSPDGLIVTNQHVANGQLQKLSTPEHNYVRDGFYAPTLEQELKCPDIDVNVFVSYEDVTSRVQGAVKPGMNDRDAAEARRVVIAGIEKDSAERTGLQSEVVKLYSGGEYWLYRYKKYADVRLVFAVEEATGFFGGDYDNFTYPRYDLDVAFFRAYENGKPARTEYLTWSAKGAEEHELVLAIGSPGTTSRLLTMAQLDFHRDVLNPTQMEVYMARRDALARYAGTGTEAARRASATRRGIENSMKRLVGQQNGLENERLMTAKMAEEAGLRKAVAANPAWQKAYGDAWDQIAAAYKPYGPYARRNAFSTLSPSRLAGFALTLVRYAEESTKPNASRLEEFRDTRLASLKATLLSTAPVYPDMEESLLESWLADGQKALGNADPFVKAALGGQTAAAVAKAAVAGTRLGDPAFRRTLFESGPDAIRQSDDPMLALARRVDPVMREVRTWIEQHITNVEATAGERIAKARFAVYGKSVYPDANSTVRISYGTVLGYEDGTTLVPYETTFYGLFDRAVAFGNKAPFFLPKRWFDRRGELDMSAPLNFAYTADTIGGNSGSPVINRKGELVGLNFDSNRQKLANRYMYIDEAEGSRAVGVHSAGIIEGLAKIYGADRIVKEIEASRK
jgi:Peptidase S46